MWNWQLRTKDDLWVNVIRLERCPRSFLLQRAMIDLESCKLKMKWPKQIFWNKKIRKLCRKFMLHKCFWQFDLLWCFLWFLNKLKIWSFDIIFEILNTTHYFFRRKVSKKENLNWITTLFEKYTFTEDCASESRNLLCITFEIFYGALHLSTKFIF
jgi:hypothetical protein